MHYTPDTCPILVDPRTGEQSDGLALLYYAALVLRCHPVYWRGLGYDARTH